MQGNERERKNGRFVPTSGTSAKSKKIKKPAKLWLPGYKFTAIDRPQELKDLKSKKKWIIRFDYDDDGNPPKRHTKLVRFGRKGQEDYVEHKDVAKKEKYLNSLRNPTNPFKGNFWNLHILNTTTDMQDNYIDLLR